MWLLLGVFYLRRRASLEAEAVPPSSAEGVGREISAACFCSPVSSSILYLFRGKFVLSSLLRHALPSNTSNSEGDREGDRLRDCVFVC